MREAFAANELFNARSQLYTNLMPGKLFLSRHLQIEAEHHKTSRQFSGTGRRTVKAFGVRHSGEHTSRIFPGDSPVVKRAVH